MNGGDRWARARAAAGHLRSGVYAPLAAGCAVGLPLVTALLANLEYDVVFAAGGDSLLGGGWAALYPDAQIAVCDTDLARTRQAYCLAHELGHLVLHATGDGAAREPGCAGAIAAIDGGPDDVTADAGYLSANEIYNPRQQREQEANVFALELLAPSELLWELFVRQEMLSSTIADRLGISQPATMNALAWLLGAGKPRATSVQADAAPAQGGASGWAKGLDPSQERAAAARGATLVTAGPGSGKTSTLVGRVAHLLADASVDPRHLLVLTYSNRAAASLRERISETLGPRAQAVTVATIHGFAQDVLRRYAAVAGVSPAFRILDEPAALMLVRRHLTDLSEMLGPLGESISLDRPLPALRGLIDAVSRAKDSLTGAEELARRAHVLAEPDEASLLLATFYPWYASMCRARDLVDYGDLLIHACTLLRDHADIRAELTVTYRWLLVDEYQDINLACGEFLKLLAPASGLWAVGDPLQAIYRWRGADPGALKQASDAGLTPGDSPAMLDLDINYRSRGPIVRLCGAVAAAIQGEPIAAGRARWKAAREPGDSPEWPVLLAEADDAEAEIDGIALEIEHEVANGRSFADHAVLCATNAQADSLARGLASRGLPISRTVAPQDDPWVRRALCILAVAAGEPDALIGLSDDFLVTSSGHVDTYGSGNGPAGGRQAMARTGLSPFAARDLAVQARLTGASILRVLTSPPDALPSDQRYAARRLAGFIEALPMAAQTFTPEVGTAWETLARYLFDRPYRAATAVLERPRSSRALHALLSAARAYDSQPRDLREPSFPAHVRLLLAAGIGIQADGSDNAEEAVRVITVHGAKGLEFPVVFIPNFVDGRFPARGKGGNSSAPAVLDADAEGSRTLDNRSLLFVALSRARDRLVLSHARTYGTRASRPSSLRGLLDEAFALEAPTRAAWKSWRSESVPDTIGASRACAAVLFASAGEPDTTRPLVDNYALETYLECPRRFYYRYRLDLGGAPGSFFAHFHTTLRRTLARIAGADDRLSVDDALAALDTEWSVLHDGHPHEDLYYQRARRTVLGYVARRDQRPTSAGQSEEGPAYRLDLRSGTIMVRIDRVDQLDDGAPVAIRYRSGRPSADHKRDVRVAMYQAALEAAHGTGAVRQEYLLTGSTDGGRARPDTLRRRLDECDAALAGIATEKFEPNRGEQCAECAFWHICPNG